MTVQLSVHDVKSIKWKTEIYHNTLTGDFSVVTLTLEKLDGHPVTIKAFSVDLKAVVEKEESK